MALLGLLGVSKYINNDELTRMARESQLNKLPQRSNRVFSARRASGDKKLKYDDAQGSLSIA